MGLGVPEPPGEFPAPGRHLTHCGGESAADDIGHVEVPAAEPHMAEGAE
jgi:hypothetical protein